MHSFLETCKYTMKRAFQDFCDSCVSDNVIFTQFSWAFHFLKSLIYLTRICAQPLFVSSLHTIALYINW